MAGGICVPAAAAFCLLVRRRALWLSLAGGVAISVGVTLVMQETPAYRQVFGAANKRFDTDRLVVLVLVGALIWWVEAQPAKRRRAMAAPSDG
jgi:hypothetical protein